MVGQNHQLTHTAPAGHRGDVEARVWDGTYAPKAAQQIQGPFQALHCREDVVGVQRSGRPLCLRPPRARDRALLWAARPRLLLSLQQVPEPSLPDFILKQSRDRLRIHRHRQVVTSSSIGTLAAMLSVQRGRGRVAAIPASLPCLPGSVAWPWCGGPARRRWRGQG